MQLPVESVEHRGATGPVATETTTRLLSRTESMLGWRLRRAGLSPREEAVRQLARALYDGRRPTESGRYKQSSRSMTYGILTAPY